MITIPIFNFCFLYVALAIFSLRPWDASFPLAVFTDTIQCAVIMRIKRTAGWDKTHTHTNPLTIWDHNQNLKENRCGATSIWNATGPQHLFLFSHLFIYLLIVSSEPLQRQSLSFGERQKKCSAHPLDGLQLLTRSQKSVQMVHFSAPSFSLPCSRFLL